MSADPYAFHARFYDRLYEPSAARLRAAGLQLAPPRDNQRVLDIGCGTGTQLALYQKPGCRLAGIDTSTAMLAMARRRLGASAELYQESGDRTRFADGTFDLASMVLVLHEMPQDMRSAVMQEARRVVSRKGRIMIIDYHGGPHPFPRGWLWKAVVTMMEISAGPEHYRNYRDFLRTGGIEGLASRQSAGIEKKYVFESGVASVYILTP